MDEYVAANRDLWDSWVPHHVASDFYGVDAFKSGGISLDPIERDAAGDVAGLRLQHLQCHFGKDTISFARLGADATGVDFSGPAIEFARELAAEVGVDARFVRSDLYDLPANLEGRFDVVFTSNGVLGWLPDLGRWAEVVAHFLAPGGRFALVEWHPILWVFDDEADGLRVRYPYFPRPDRPLRFEYRGSYAVPDAPVESVEHGWPHSVAEVLQSLIDAGLAITRFEEHERMAWQALPVLERGDDGFWRLPEGLGELPLSMTVGAVKP